MIASRKDLSAGAIFAAFGLVYGYQSLFGMKVGTVSRMGPGFFPLALSLLLVVIGLAVGLRGLRRGAAREAMDAVPWRPILLISFAVLVFAMFADRLGMLPVTFLTATIAAFARKDTKPGAAVALGATIAVLCSLLFTVALGLPLPVLGSWLR